MSDILSQYFKNISKQKLRSFSRQNSTLSGDLSEYGLSLSDSNMLAFTPHKVKKGSKLILPNCLSENSTKKSTLLKMPNNDNNIFVQINEDNCFKPIIKKENKKKKVKFKNHLNNRNNLLLIYKNNLNYKLTNNTIKQKNDYNIKNNDKDKNSSLNISGINNKKNKLNSKDKEKINLIIQDLMKMQKKRRNLYKKKTFSISDLIQKPSTINPMKYIRLNFSEYPHKLSKFKSHKIQIKALGNLKYRNIILDEIKFYKDNHEKYNYLNNIAKENEDIKSINKKIKEMLEDKKFNNAFKNLNANSYKKNKILKNNFTFSFDSKDMEKNKRIDNLNLRLNAISKNDINNLNNYIEKNRKYFSFDKKIELFLLRANKTSNYIKKKTEEYDRINKVIFNFIM